MKVLKVLLITFLNLILSGITWFFVTDYFLNESGSGSGGIIGGALALLIHIAIIVICLVLYGVLLSYVIM